MSVLCAIQSIIVRKIPNSRRDALTRSHAPTPLRSGHRPRGRPGNTSSIVGIPLAATGGDVGGGMMMTMVVMTSAGALRNARLRSSPRPTFAQTRSDMLRPISTR